MHAVGATLVVARIAYRVPPTGLVKCVMPGPSPGSHRPPGTGDHKGRPYIILTSARTHCYRFPRCCDPFRLAEASD